MAPAADASGAVAVPVEPTSEAAARAPEVADGEALIVFTPSGKRGHFPLGTPLLQAARELGVDIDSVCGGRGICGRCQVTLSEGAFAKHGIQSAVDHLSTVSSVETRYAERRGLKPGRRLSCSTQLLGDAVIDVPPDSQRHKQIVRKRAEARDIELDAVVRLYYVEVDEPDMHDPSGDFRRLQKALAEEWRVEVVAADLAVLLGLQGALREGEWKVTVAVRGESRVVALWPGYHDRIFGLAVDVGSTTVAAHLCDLATGEVVASSGAMNPQIRFGEDLMSRVSYIMMNPGGEVEMTAVVREAIAELARAAAEDAGIETGSILDVTIVGNPIMHHLVLGIDPKELGWAPFALATDQSLEILASELDLGLHPGARVYTLPCIAGHVGADAAAVVLSETPYLSDEIMLVVDVGTNAEIILGTKDRLLACSSPTGPAFEGAQISSGQRAAPGAIERVRIDPETLEPRFRVIGSELWSNEDGFDEATKRIGVTGICGSGIIEAVAEMFLAGILTRDGIIDGAATARTNHVREDGRTYDFLLHGGEVDVVINQNDIRAIQLAKGALYAGIRLLMDKLEIAAVERIVLAGAFGSHIDVKYAMVLGLIPDCDLAKVASAGNAAGTGARIALLNGKARREIEAVVRRIEKIETAVEPRFQEHFVDAMAIPHRIDRFENLAGVVTLPDPGAAPAGAGGRRRKRRRD